MSEKWEYRTEGQDEVLWLKRDDDIRAQFDIERDDDGKVLVEELALHTGEELESIYDAVRSAIGIKGEDKEAIIQAQDSMRFLYADEDEPPFLKTYGFCRSDQDVLQHRFLDDELEYARGTDAAVVLAAGQHGETDGPA